MTELIKPVAPRVSPLLSALKQRRATTPEVPTDVQTPTLAVVAAGPDVPVSNVSSWFRGQAATMVGSIERRPPAMREVTRLPRAEVEPSLGPVNNEVPTRPKPEAPAFGESTAQLKARRSRRQLQRWGILASFLAIVAAPSIIAATYYLFVASDQYVSEVKFALRSVDHNGGRDTTGGAANALAGNTDSFIIADYVTTRQFVDEIHGKIDLRKIFSRPSADFWSRFDPAAPIEALVQHWRSMVVSRYDLSTGILTVKVRAYTPEDSFRLAQTVIEGSERLANELTNRGRQDFVRFAEAEVHKAEDRLQSARNALGSFRRKEGTFDPVRLATSNADLTAKLRSDLSGMRAEAASLSASMQPGAPMIQTLNNRIKATEQQLRAVEVDGQRNNQGEGGDMGSLVARFAALDAEQTFAEKSYGMAMDALRGARGLADRQQVYLATFARPALAESAQFPNRPAAIALVVGFAMLIWITGLLIVLGIRDHMR